MADPHDHYHDDFDDEDECPYCGGEGRVAGTCIDGCCLERENIK